MPGGPTSLKTISHPIQRLIKNWWNEGKKGKKEEKVGRARSNK